MKTSTHSPAPWSLRGDILRDANGTPLYRLTPLEEITIAQDLANRALIEAAPEMKAMLREAVDAMTAHGIAGSHYNVQHMADLLAKLEGAS